MRKQILSITAAFIGLGLALNIQAQDPQFTQFYAAPIYTNPAMAGSAVCNQGVAGRFAINYRNQWPSLKGTYQTVNASWDQHFDAIGGGLGAMITRDVAGSGLLTTTSVSGVYSYVIPVNKNFFFRTGLQATFVDKRLDFNKLQFADQINPTQGFVYQTNEPLPTQNVSFPNFGAGVLGYSANFYVGFAMHNIIEPNQSFYGNQDAILPRRYTAHTGVKIPLEKRRNPDAFISPNLLFMMQQNFTQINFGFYVNKGPLVSGLWFRQTAGTFGNSDAIIALLGFRKDRLKFGYSYDITVSSARPAAQGSHEVSLAVDWCLKKGRPPFKPIRCPEF